MSQLESLHLSHTQIPAPAGFDSARTRTETLYLEAEKNRLAFWDTQAQVLHWESPWRKTMEWDRPTAQWFVGGTLNAATNCTDVHLLTHRRNKTAILWEGEDGRTAQLSYAELHDSVARFAWLLRHRYGVKKGDRVTLYMPLIPQLTIAVLACARIGAIHSVIFGGFSTLSVRDRILDSQSEVIITANAGYRRGGIVPLLPVVMAATDGLSFVRHILSYAHIPGLDTPTSTDDWDTEMATVSAHQKAEIMDSEDPLFILYTSGTTGKPKGILHTTGGYMVHANYSTRIVFDLRDNDVYWCTADIGWITGHTYVVYGPLSNGATVLMYEGAPDFPDKDRFWQLIEKYKVSIFYTAPTAIRAFMKWGDNHPNAYTLSSLRLLGSVGEPINPEAWDWYYRTIGKSRCPIVDTWWQTETGGIMITTLPGISPMKPGVAGRPLPGIEAAILAEDGTLVSNGAGYLSLTSPWPSMARSIWGDHERFVSVYWARFDTYFAGDGAVIDADGDIMILGRVDDVLNVSGHRIGTMEVESALVDHPIVAEAAVVGVSDSITGVAIWAFVVLKEGAQPVDTLEFQNHVAKCIGAIAKPKKIILTPDLPKTRSGKIMRRILKNLAEGQPSGDSSTLANPQIVALLTDLLK